MLLVTTVMYEYVTVTAAVCNNSNDNNGADVDAHGIITYRKKGNFVVLSLVFRCDTGHIYCFGVT